MEFLLRYGMSVSHCPSDARRLERTEEPECWEAMTRALMNSLQLWLPIHGCASQHVLTEAGKAWEATSLPEELGMVNGVWKKGWTFLSGVATDTARDLVNNLPFMLMYSTLLKLSVSHTYRKHESKRELVGIKGLWKKRGMKQDDGGEIV